MKIKVLTRRPPLCVISEGGRQKPPSHLPILAGVALANENVAVTFSGVFSTTDASGRG